MKASIITILATFSTVGVVDAARLKGGMQTNIKGRKDRHLLGDLTLSMPEPTQESVVNDKDIVDLLRAGGFDAGVNLDIRRALGISGVRMSGMDSKDRCVSLLDDIFDLLLFSGAVEDAIKVILCGEEEDHQGPGEEEDDQGPGEEPGDGTCTGTAPYESCNPDADVCCQEPGDTYFCDDADEADPTCQCCTCYPGFSTCPE